MTPPPLEGFSVPTWAIGVLVLLVTFGPGVASFFFVRWLRRKDEAEKEAKAAEAQAAKEAKEREEKKLDDVLSGVKKIERDFFEHKERFSASDQLQNQLKGSLEKVEERINGIGNTYGRRLGDLEAKVERLDERTRNDPPAPRRRR